MKKILFTLVICAGMLTLAACSFSSITSRLPGGAKPTPKGGSKPTASAAELTGKIWALKRINGAKPVAGTGITAQFSADGKLSGSAGCNQYAGAYKVIGNGISISQPMAATMMACEQPVMDQEAAYLKALGEAKTFSIAGDQLTLHGADKKPLLVFQAQSQDLAGSSWEVTGYNNGKQAVVSPLNGTTLTADFGNDGSLSGKSGCNTYSGSFKTTGDQITIGPLASTMMACADPAGVMDQEAQYLAALQSAATYQIDGNMMTLRTKDGAMAATFARK